MTQEFIRPSVLVEQATPEDAAAVFNVQRRTWLDTYPNEEFGITYEDIKTWLEGQNGELVPQKVERWRQGIEMDGANLAVFVTRQDDKVIGFVSPAVVDGQRRIGAIYVLPEAQGRGVGDALLEKAIEWHGRDKDIYLHVASYNQKAIDFYERNGFVVTNNHVEEVVAQLTNNTTIPEIEMVLESTSSSAESYATL